MKTKVQTVEEVIQSGTTKEELAEIYRVINQFEQVIKHDVTSTEIIEIEKLVKVHSGKLFDNIQKIVDDNQDKAGALIRVLQQAQGIVGYLPKPVMAAVSYDLKVPFSEVYGVASFYHFFSMKPKGKYVLQVCLGTSCYVKGGDKILERLKKDWNLEPGGITPDGRFSLEIVRCLGACGLSPVMAVGTDIHGRVKPGKINEILDSYN
jgi:NADH:ubiquinone oxidoreductase subunit E